MLYTTLMLSRLALALCFWLPVKKSLSMCLWYMASPVATPSHLPSPLPPYLSFFLSPILFKMLYATLMLSRLALALCFWLPFKKSLSMCLWYMASPVTTPSHLPNSTSSMKMSSSLPHMASACIVGPSRFSLIVKVQPFLFFHENAGNIAHKLEFIDLMMQRLRCNVFMLSCQGYGASDGFPSQHGLMTDAQATLDYLLERIDIDTIKLIVFRRSLGGAIGAALMRNNSGKVATLILENTFTLVLDMASVMLPVLKWSIGETGSKGLTVLNFLQRSPWNTHDIIQNVSKPILFLFRSPDEMVLPAHMKQLYFALSSNNKSLLHNQFKVLLEHSVILLAKCIFYHHMWGVHFSFFIKNLRKLYHKIT